MNGAVGLIVISLCIHSLMLNMLNDKISDYDLFESSDNNHSLLQERDQHRLQELFLETC